MAGLTRQQRIRKLSTDIGVHIKQIMSLHGMSVKYVASILYPKIDGLGLSTVRSYISSIRSGWFICYRMNDRSLSSRLGLLSIIMYYVGINDQDDLVTRTREFYPQFEFPPPPDKQVVLEVRSQPERSPYNRPDLLNKIGRLRSDDLVLLEQYVDNILAGYQLESK